MLLAGLAMADPPPENAVVTLSSDRESWFLGETILIHYKLANSGGEAFKAGFGGDFRGGYQTRYRIKAVNAHTGEPVDSWPPLPSGGGGRPTSSEITPESPYEETLAISHWLELAKPGRYTIRVRHDAGWTETPDQPVPSGSITLEIREPTPEEAKDALDRMLALPDGPPSEPGKKSEPYSKLSLVRHSAYLPALIAWAPDDEKGARAIEGIASIATPEASRALLDVAGDQDQPHWRLALQQLNRRLRPQPHFDGVFVPAGLGNNPLWAPELNEDARAAACAVIGSMEAPVCYAASSLLRELGQTEDRAAVAGALDEIYEANGRGEVLDRNRHAAICSAALAMAKRDGVPGFDQPRSRGEAIFFLYKLQEDKDFRPENWEATCEQLLADWLPDIRQKALYALPKPLDVRFTPHVQAALAGNHGGPAQAAIAIIQRDNLGHLVPNLLDQIRFTNNASIIWSASRAAQALGASYSSGLLLVDRMENDPAQFRQYFYVLINLMTNGCRVSARSGDPPENLTEIAAAWREMIEAHEAELTAGDRIPVPNEFLTPSLVPEGWRLWLKTGEQWPPEEK